MIGVNLYLQAAVLKSSTLCDKKVETLRTAAKTADD